LPHNVTIDDLALANRPWQFGLLERATQVFTQSQSVTNLLVRGSLATGTADRMSDVDFVVGVKDADLAQFVRALDPLMTIELAAILPGWRDTIVSRMGGLGYVYLVVNNGCLYQIDIYVVPESLVSSIQQRTGARPLYGKAHEASANTATQAVDPSVAAFVDDEWRRPQTCSAILIEIMVLIQMMQKRIKRGQRFVLHAETGLLMNAVKELLKTALVPTSAYWGWYHLDEEIGVTPIGRDCLAELFALISAPPNQTPEALASTFTRIEGIVSRAAPESLSALGPAIDTYKHYLELV
jgi:predicted nucleotidyltransferase